MNSVTVESNRNNTAHSQHRSPFVPMIKNDYIYIIDVSNCDLENMFMKTKHLLLTNHDNVRRIFLCNCNFLLL
jgi:hypothetical protein